MQCPNCRSSSREGVNFCEECGAELEITCPACSARLPPDKKFCGRCGANLTPVKEDLTEAPGFDEKLGKAQKYLPAALIEKILSDKHRIEGERKQVTVLFCDIKDSTPLVETIGAERAFAMMAGVYDILIKKIHAYEGTVNGLTGDGIMALFSAPLAVEDAPQRAIRAASAIHREVTKYNVRLQQDHKTPEPIKMRIGMHSGPVAIGRPGNDLRVELKAIGNAVNIASRRANRGFWTNSARQSPTRILPF